MYLWHREYNKRRITLHQLAGIVITGATDALAVGDIAYAKDGYFRLGGKCSAACKLWYGEHIESDTMSTIEKKHYRNYAHPKPRKPKGETNV
jgi:hypothetical protein